MYGNLQRSLESENLELQSKIEELQSEMQKVADENKFFVQQQESLWYVGTLITVDAKCNHHVHHHMQSSHAIITLVAY
jgi:hypothetical protein